MSSTEYRRALPEEVPQIVDFLNMVFSVDHEPHNFPKLLPKVYAHDDFWRIQYVAAREGRILAGVTLLPLTLTIRPGITLKAGFVGGVSVHPYFRGEGHMKALLSKVIRDAREDGLDLLVLGGQRQRYGHFGFGKADPVINYEINPSNVRHALADTDDSGITFETVEPGMTEMLEKIRHSYLAGQDTCDRGERLYDYLLSWKATPEAILNKGQYIGYCCRNDAEVFELRLDEPEMFRNVVKAFVKQYGGMQGNIALTDPEFRTEVADFAEDISVTDSGMVRVLNWQGMLEKLLSVRAMDHPVRDGQFCLGVNGEGQFRITAKDGKPSVTEEADGNGPVLTPEKAVDLLFSVAGAINCTDPWLKEILPLPFHMGTTDHF